jgi:hypothetical protein
MVSEWQDLAPPYIVTETLDGFELLETGWSLEEILFQTLTIPDMRVTKFLTGLLSASSVRANTYVKINLGR